MSRLLRDAIALIFSTIVFGATVGAATGACVIVYRWVLS